jgi:hypothetical protein
MWIGEFGIKADRRVLEKGLDIRPLELPARSRKRVEIEGRSPTANELPICMASGSRNSDPCSDIRVLLRTCELAAGGASRLVRFGAMPAAFKVRPAQLLRELLGEAERDCESVRCPDRQNTKIVGTQLDLEFP